MNHSHRNKRFKLSQRGVMLTLISAALSQSALANTGLVYFATGSIVDTDPKGQVNKLVKGTEVRSGDKITSGGDGRAQIRFSDGAYVSLQPNTQFEIKEYRFDGKADGTESALFGLFKGAMRTITGLVGHTDHSKYQINTVTATLGIRGTGGLIVIGNDGSTLISGSSGTWTLSNLGGTIDVPAGTSGFAGANINVPPQLVNEGPVIPPPQSGPQILPPINGQCSGDTGGDPSNCKTIVQGDVVNLFGGPVSIFWQPLMSGSGYASAAVAASVQNADGSWPTYSAATPAVFNSAGQLTSFTTSAGATITLAGSQVDSGTIDGVIAWGRWIGQVISTSLATGTTTTVLSANDGLHYVIGTAATNMPASGTFTYNLVGATSPTFANASAAPGVLNSASLVGNFTSGTVAVNLSATAGGNTYTGTANGTVGATFTASGIATAPGTACFSCTLNVDGFFAGTGATHAGIVYQITGVNNGTTTLNGAAAFKR